MSDKWVPCQIGRNGDGATLIGVDFRLCVWSDWRV